METKKLGTVIVSINTIMEETKLENKLEKIINEIIKKELKTTDFEYALNITYKMKGE